MLHTGKPIEVMLAAIRSLDLESVKVRIMDPKLGEGWTRDYADSIERSYKTYLSMLVKHPEEAEDILLSKDVDEFWHTHILQTLKYHEDCEAVFGKYLHHNPHIGAVTDEDHAKREAQAEKTRLMYQREFGDAATYEAAWSGRTAAYSSVGAGTAAYSSASVVRAENAAYSSATAVRAENAAYSSATAVRAENAAYSSAVPVDRHPREARLVA